jgi:cytochrome c oxidase accessory protein FixG
MSDESYDVDDIQLFAKQRKVYPRAVAGIYRRRKWIIMSICLALYYFAPFLRWDRGPHAPDQAILIDMVGRRAYFFFIEIWPQEVYYFTAILVFAAIAIIFATSMLGRVWCGYLCFQTIWTDLFLWVENLFQGDRAERIKQDNSPWSINKLWRKLATHISWILIGLFTGGTFVLYFNDAPTLIADFLTGDVSSNVLAFVFGLTASTYIMAGFAREQVCTFMCPYARFQSAMFDEDSLIIAYDKQRGEPRGKHKKGESWDGRGHCIDCTQCVQACPMGIDIRDGLQLQCIACGLCIDACDSVMDKIGMPRGLVRYDTDRNLRNQAPGTIVTKPPKLRLLRPRTFLYSAVLLILGTVILVSLLSRNMVDMRILHDRNPLFVQLSSGEVRNGYFVNILNRELYPQTYRLSISGIDQAKLEIQGSEGDTVTVPPDNTTKVRVFVVSPAKVEDRIEFMMTLTPVDGGDTVTHKTFFVSRGVN